MKKSAHAAQTHTVLPPATRALARKIAKDPKLAEAFLKSAGIIEKPGLLSREYRSTK